MKTFILMWNPAISSYTWQRFKEDQEEICNDDWYEGVGNWSVWDYNEVEEDDRFFMVKVGEGKTGIVMAGYFCSGPYEDEDWSGKGRPTRYADLTIQAQIDPDLADIITTEELTKEIPDFDWTGGHSGRLLDETSAEKLELLWLKYINKIRFNKKANAVFIKDINELSAVAERYFSRHKGHTCEKCGYNFQKVFGDDCEETVPYRLYLSENDKEPVSEDELLSRVKCICYNCNIILEDELIYNEL